MPVPEQLQHQMLVMLALVGNSFMWPLILPSCGPCFSWAPMKELPIPSWAIPSCWILGANLLTSGLLYLALPFDIIPDNVPLIGRLDNYVAVAVSALGVHFMKVAHDLLPMSPALMNLLQMATTYDEVNYVNVTCVAVLLAFLTIRQIRYTMIGLLAIACVPCAFLSQLAVPWAVGASFLVIGITYTMLPIDIIPDWIPLIGKVDDTIIGGGGIVVGATILACAFYVEVPVFDRCWGLPPSLQHCPYYWQDCPSCLA